MDINKYIVKNKLEAKHLLSLDSFSAEDIFEVLYLAKKIKMRAKAKEKISPLSSKNIAFMISSKNSRYRAPFELSVRQLGGTTLYISPEDAGFQSGFTYLDAIRVLKSYGVNALVTKLDDQPIVKELAKNSTLPLINVLEGFDNPCQVLADLFTIWEKKGKLNDLKMAIISSEKMFNGATLNAYTKVGISINLTSPKALYPEATTVAEASQYEDLVITDKLNLALTDADIITTRYSSYSTLNDAQKEKLKAYTLTKELFETAKADAIFMHKLPVVKDVEVSDEIIYGDRSTVFEQSENLIYIQQAVICLLLENY